MVLKPTHLPYIKDLNYNKIFRYVKNSKYLRYYKIPNE